MDTITLPPVIDTDAAGVLLTDLLRAFNAGSGIVIDTSPLTRIGLAGIQVLASAKLSFSREGRSVTLVGEDGVLRESSKTIGLYDVIFDNPSERVI